MCGIFGYIGKLNAFEEVLNGLKMLQYRGYDSCGIAYYADNQFKIEKAVGTLSNLTIPNIACNNAFGHTRWATNGEVNLANTHPHLSFNQEFTIVHNGIINNADNIKADLLKQGATFSSQTDTEVIANLLACTGGSYDDRIKLLHTKLNGSYSLIIGLKNGTIYLVKKFSPLNILKCEDGIYVSSDVSSLKSGELYTLKDYDIIKIENNNIIQISGQNLVFNNYINNIKQMNLGKFSHFMQKEIFETPNAIYNTYLYLKNKNIKEIFNKKVKNLTFIACGTAYHSCLIGQQLFNNLNYETNAILASNFELNGKIAPNHLHIIVSQSGETADCIKAAEQIKQHGGKILVITNEEKSSLTQFANFTILTKAQKEIAVASTKTYCCQVFVFAYMALKLANENYTLNINSFIQTLNEFINSIDINQVADELIDKQNLILIGKEIDYLTLLEASLKIREIDYIYTLPIYSGELKHGTLSLVDKNCTILCLNTGKQDSLKTVINEIVSRDGKVIEFNLNIQDLDIEEQYVPIFSVIPFQLLSYQIAIKKGLNPDMPRNLAKSVTVE